MVGGVRGAQETALGWRHGFGDIVPVSLHTLAGGGSFSVAGAATDRNAALVEAGFDFMLAGARAELSYDGEFGTHLRNHTLKGTLRADF